MTADELQYRARALHAQAITDANKGCIPEPVSKCVGDYQPTAVGQGMPTRPIFGPDNPADTFGHVCTSFLSMSREDRDSLAGLTPDQWLVLIALIGDIILKIVERRNPRPTP